MARRISRKELKRDEFVEATADATHWIEDHWADVVKWAVALLLVGVVVLAWVQWNRTQSANAASELATAIDRYQTLENAGFADTSALSDVIEQFASVAEGSTPSAAAARLYAGAASFRLGKHEDAVTHLSAIASDTSQPGTLRSTARAMLVEALLAAGKTEQATAELEAQIAADDPMLPASRALLQMAAAHARSGDSAAERQTLQRVVDEHPDSPEAREAKERLES